MATFLKLDTLIVVFLLLQALFWTQVKSIKPDMTVLPELQSRTAVRALSFGDEQFYFRTLSFDLQNAGDTYGRTTPLKDYDYEKLHKWFMLLDWLDPRSNIIPSLASYYYSNTQYKPDVNYIVDYLEQHADNDPSAKWWWYAQAVYNAKHKLGDTERALKIAYKLAGVPADVDMPLWARQMPAFIHEQMGELEQAGFIMRDLIENHESLTDGELNFMYHFLAERVERFEQLKKEGSVSEHE